MFLQDDDPHHMHVDYSYAYYFVILAVIIAAAVLYAGVNFMRFLDERYERKQTDDKNPENSPASDRRIDS